MHLIGSSDLIGAVGNTSTWYRGALVCDVNGSRTNSWISDNVVPVHAKLDRYIILKLTTSVRN